MDKLETLLKNTAFFAIFVIAGLAGFSLWKFLALTLATLDGVTVPSVPKEGIAAAKEITILAITSIGSLATGGALGYMAGRMTGPKKTTTANGVVTEEI